MTESEASSLPTDPLERVLARLEELERAASPAPWATYNSANGWHYSVPDSGAIDDVRKQSKAQAEFIAAIRNAAPALLALAREAQADVKYGRDRGLSQYVRRPQVYASDLLLYALEELAKLEIP